MLIAWLGSRAREGRPRVLSPCFAAGDEDGTDMGSLKRNMGCPKRASYRRRDTRLPIIVECQSTSARVRVQSR